MNTKDIEIKIKNIKKNIEYYSKVYPGSKKIIELENKLNYYRNMLANMLDNLK